jgi:hypothetical protein
MEDDSDILKKLESLKKQDVFKVPDNYFDTFVPRLQDKIHANEAKKQSVFAVFKQKPALAYSTIFVCAVFIAFVGLKTIWPMIQNSSSKQMKTEEIALFLDNQAFSIDDATLANSMDTEKEIVKPHTEQNDTIKYLLENNVNSDDILNAL